MRPLPSGRGVHQKSPGRANKMVKVIISVEGGLARQICSNDPSVQVTIIDYDGKQPKEELLAELDEEEKADLRLAENAKPWTAKSVLMKKQFDIGLFSFKRQVNGSVCPEDDKKLHNGAVLAVIYPVQVVDSKNLYAFGIDRADLSTKTVVRKNLRFTRMITLTYEDEPTMEPFQIVHAKLNAVIAYFQKEKASQLDIIVVDREAEEVLRDSLEADRQQQLTLALPPPEVTR